MRRFLGVLDTIFTTLALVATFALIFGVCAFAGLLIYAHVYY